MCMRVIVDSNSLHLLTEGRKEDRRLVKWIADGHGTLCHPRCGKFRDEMSRNLDFGQLVKRLESLGNTRVPSVGEIAGARQTLAEVRGTEGLQSDDEHVPEVVVAARAEMIVSDDTKFRKDVETISREADVSPLFCPTGEKGDPKQRRRRADTTPKTLRKNQLRFLESHKCRMR